ncbi:hypothetical protein [Paracoccus pacificus]|uniref:Uncharacterized protein n=1 Tax=Paracoccus pacificus TaxID=1463598 RepID=A0ABW4RAU7_9RHOB
MNAQQEFQQIEYNTEVLGNTFQRIASINSQLVRCISKPEPLEVDGSKLETSLLRMVRQFEASLASRLAEKAIKRLFIAGRWENKGPAELICEVVTDKTIRKGCLSTNGRKDRARKIAEMIRENGRVDFAILLLPFRTATPIKNKGMLPDLGEFYTLATLRAIAKACNTSQAKMRQILNLVAARASADVYGCVERVYGKDSQNVPAIFDEAITRCDQTGGAGKEMAVARKRLGVKDQKNLLAMLERRNLVGNG